MLEGLLNVVLHLQHTRVCSQEGAKVIGRGERGAFGELLKGELSPLSVPCEHIILLGPSFHKLASFLAASARKKCNKRAGPSSGWATRPVRTIHRFKPVEAMAASENGRLPIDIWTVACGWSGSLCLHESDRLLLTIVLFPRLHMRILRNKRLVAFRRWLLESHTAALRPMRLYPFVTLCGVRMRKRCVHFHEEEGWPYFGHEWLQRSHGRYVEWFGFLKGAAEEEVYLKREWENDTKAEQQEGTTFLTKTRAPVNGRRGQKGPLVKMSVL